MSDFYFSENAFLRSQLHNVVNESSELYGLAAGQKSDDVPMSDSLTVVVTMNEINDRHGTGPLVARILSGRRRVMSIRSRDDWGLHTFRGESLKLSAMITRLALSSVQSALFNASLAARITDDLFGRVLRGDVIAAVFPFLADLGRDPPDRGVIKQEGLDPDLDEVDQIVVPPDVRELVGQECIDLRSREPGERTGGQENDRPQPADDRRDFDERRFDQPNGV